LIRIHKNITFCGRREGFVVVVVVFVVFVVMVNVVNLVNLVVKNQLRQLG